MQDSVPGEEARRETFLHGDGDGQNVKGKHKLHFT